MAKKKNSLDKRLQRLTQAAMRNLAVYHMGATTLPVTMINVKSLRIRKPSPTMKDTLVTQRYKWSTVCAVFLRDQFGKEYMKSVAINSLQPELQGDLVKTLVAEHEQLISECNDSHFINVGWLSTPYAYEWEPDVEGSIFSSLNAWDGLAKWEAV